RESNHGNNERRDSGSAPNPRIERFDTREVQTPAKQNRNQTDAEQRSGQSFEPFHEWRGWHPASSQQSAEQLLCGAVWANVVAIHLAARDPWHDERSSGKQRKAGR